MLLELQGFGQLSYKRVAVLPGSFSLVFLAGGSSSTSGSSPSLDTRESQSSPETSSPWPPECDVNKLPKSENLAFIESLRPSNELLRASAMTETRAVTFKVTEEFPSFALFFGVEAVVDAFSRLFVKLV